MADIQPSRWSLADLFSSPESPEFMRAQKKLDRLVRRFIGRRSALTPRIRTTEFLEIIQSLEEIRALAARWICYAHLRFSEDTQDPRALAFLANSQQRLTEIENHILYFSLWWKQLPVSAAHRLLAGAGRHRYFLEEMLHYRPHTLGESEEQIINIKNSTGSEALGTLYHAITNRFTFDLEIAGERKSLTRGELSVHFQSADPAARAAAYQSLFRVYEKEGPVLGQIYYALALDWQNENVGLRHFRSPISARNLANDIPDKVVHLLLDVCQANASVFQDFFRLKARRLGRTRLRRYDLYAPISSSEKKYSFSEACRLVDNCFEAFDPRMAALARKVRLECHLDSEVRPGKRDGAFCMSVLPDSTPWVLVNFQGRSHDISTLAHELGHAVHSLLAADKPIFAHQASLPLAETASTFAEMLLADRLLAVEPDPAIREDLLFRQLDNAYATIGRQAYFALFEEEAHAQILEGASVDDLCGAYLENLQKQFGDSLDISDEFRWEWTAIPHFFESPFYVYAYSFGQLLVLALYQRYREEGARFTPRYLEILSAGGAASPTDILRQAGIRIEKAEFWQGGFNLLAERIAQLA